MNKFVACCFIAISLGAGLAADNDRAADREAIRAHIDSIYQAFIHKDGAALKATHGENWRGFLTGSNTMIRGIDQYMKTVSGGLTGPYGMTAYKLRDFDVVFAGDNAAFATFISEADVKTPAGMQKQVLRLGDFYVKNNGHWIQAGSNTSLHPESAAEQMSTPGTLPEQMKKNLLESREAVWRAFFANDRAALEKLVPEDTITIEPGGGGEFGNQKMVLAGAAQFAKSGARLARLEFPKTEIQLYGYTAIVYSTYLYEVEKDGKRQTTSGRVTEFFVLRNGHWVNPGWHMDSGT
ncbi:MAG TPA: nuclear transport factor 2 family protein [Bryobacteraceae bacterium]|nr:nuclear transport factor 2 family protein [Bryobacteraceae bacterium]